MILLTSDDPESEQYVTEVGDCLHDEGLDNCQIVDGYVTYQEKNYQRGGIV